MNKLFPAATVLHCVFATSLVMTSACHITISTDWSDFSDNESDFGETAVRDETRELAIASGQKMRIEVPHGDIRLHTETSGSPSLHAKITSHGATQAEAREVADAARLIVESTSDGIVVRVDDSPATQEIEGGTMRVGSRFDIDAALPAGVELSIATQSGTIKVVGPFSVSELRSGYGNIDASGIEGSLVIRSSSGTLAASAIHGERIEAATSYGNVRLENCRVTTAVAKSSSGDIRVKDVDADRIEVNSGYGNAHVEHVHGDLEVKLSSGTARLEDSSGGRLSLKSSYGNLLVARSKGDLSAATSSGSVKVSDFEGRLDARSGYGSVNAAGVFSVLTAESSSGNVDVRAETGSRVEDAWKLSSSYGSVKLGVPRDLACELSAKTGYGEVDVGLAIEVAAGALKPGKSVHGRINGGGNSVSLQSANGNVRLYPLE